MTPKTRPPTVKLSEKTNLHPRNRHRGRYDFADLARTLPALAHLVIANPFDAREATIDFADALAVRTLNAALLKKYYGIAHWPLPSGYLCPPIPGRADYLHHVADLLAADGSGIIPRGPTVRVLDIGVGANCIYPLIGQHEYGWKFVGSDIDAAALAVATEIVNANAGLSALISLRLQTSQEKILTGIITPDERFDLVICNPPFHRSAHAAEVGAIRKWKNLGRAQTGESKPPLNFGGHAAELWCEGGEVGFVTRMVAESATYQKQVAWFSALVSSEANLPAIYAALKLARVAEVETISMAQGQKKSRIVAWRF